MFNINKEIEQYLVQLRFYENNGSGVLVKPFEKSEYLYIFTAKHTFEISDEYDFKNYISPIDKVDKFEIRTSPYSRCKLYEVISFKKIDLVVLIIKNNNYSFWGKIPTIKIFNDVLDSNLGYVIAGFPKAKDYRNLAFYEMKFVIKKSYILELESKKPLEMFDTNEVDTNGGISGGGLFVEGNNNQLYLIGIEVEFEPLNNLICIDLRDILDKINVKLIDKIEVGGYPLFDKYDLSDKKFDLEFLEKELRNDYIKEIENDALNIIRDNQLEVNQKLEKEYQDTIKKMQDLANSFLYRGAVLNGRDNFASTKNFRRAMILNSKLEKYLIQAKYIRNSENYRKIDDKRERDNQISIDVLKAQIEETSISESLRKLYIDLIYHLERYEDKHIEEIADYKKRLINLYIDELLFQDAERILENRELNRHLEDEYIKKNLMAIYFHPSYQKRTELTKKEFANKLINLLGILNFESEEYLKTREKLRELNSFDDYIFDLGEKLIKSEQSFKAYEEKIAILTKQMTFLSKHVSDKKILHDINFKVFDSNKKLDKIEKLQDKSIDTTIKGIYKQNKENANSRFLWFGIFLILGILVLTNKTIMNFLNTLI